MLFRGTSGESQEGNLGNESLAGTQGPRREKSVTKSAGGDGVLCFRCISENILTLAEIQ